MRLVELKPEHVFALVGMCKAMQQESPAYRDYEFSVDQLMVYVDLCLRTDEWRCMLAVKESEPIGFYAATCQPMLFSQETSVDDLAIYIKPEHRGSLMAGPRMIGDIIKWAQRKNARVVRLGVTTGISNDRITQLLTRFGFSQTGTLSTLQI
jgi:GNAT superfamily N-acetyltransferase